MKIKRTLHLTPESVAFQCLSQILRCQCSLMRFGNLAILIKFNIFQLLIEHTRIFSELLPGLLDILDQRVEISEDLHRLLVALLLLLVVVLLHLLLHIFETLILED